MGIESEIQSFMMQTTFYTSSDGSDSDDSSDDLLFSAQINDDNGDDHGLNDLIEDGNDENGYDVVISFENRTYYNIWAIFVFFIISNLICYAFYRIKSKEAEVRLS